MIIEITEDEYYRIQKILKQKQSFTDSIKTNPIENLIGKRFSDQEGIFAGRNNDEYYFVDFNKENAKMNWWRASELFGKFRLPTKKEMMFLFVNKEMFNHNCEPGEEWFDVWYWTLDELSCRYLGGRAEAISFNHANVGDVSKDTIFHVRCVRTIKFK